MKKTRKIRCGFFVLIGFPLAFTVCTEQENKDPLQYVNPFICTLGDHGQLFPGAVVPFGMIKLGPDTYPSSLTGAGNWAHSGYNYADTMIRGFSHIRRESSGGTRSYDHGFLVSVLPTVGIPNRERTELFARIDKKSEKASPGLYQVNLSDFGIKAAMTCQTHSGLHRYQFPQTEDAHILIDPGGDYLVVGSHITVRSPTEFSGTVNGPRASVYYWAELGKPCKSFSTGDQEMVPGQKECTGKRAGAILDFDTAKDEIIYLKVGFSLVSAEQARLNLQAEIPDWEFAATVAKAEDSWRDLLARIEVKGDEEYKTIFYTALYHSCQQPSNLSDVNGQYLGYDQQTHTAETFHFHENYSFWDDYRTKFPLMSLINPQTMKDVVYSILELYRTTSEYWYYSNPKHEPHRGGFVVAGKNGFRPFLTCRYEHMLTVVLDAYAKGIVHDNMQLAYQGMRKEIMTQMPEMYDTIGYIPARPDQTFEYCYDNWCVAQMARRLGLESDYAYFMKRAGFYANTWDSRIGFLRARQADGTWLDFPESPTINREKYMYEGTPWQWRWFVPHDVPGMIAMMGGNDKFIADLDYFFSNNLYQAGNQPDIHAPFLFNPAGAAWLTQKWVRTFLAEPVTQLYATHGFFKEPIRGRIYKASPDGYLEQMDDDYGSMAAYYVLSAMGLYQLCPGDPVYQLTAPIFDHITIHLDRTFYPGKTFTIQARNLSKDHIYIQSATLNGQPFNKSSITHEQIVHGGELIFEMGAQPNKNWGR